MLANERHSLIVEEVSRKSVVSIRNLTELLGVSRETVRKDIEYLSKKGKLNQVRGGAMRVLDWEPPIADRIQANPEGKAAIADMVVDRIGDGASVLIDSGSTTLVAAEQLAKARKALTIYTNDLKIALTLGPVAKEVVLLGGRMDLRENAVFGLEAIECLSRYRAEFALIGIGGLSVKGLVTDFSRETAALRERMMANCETAFVLADSSKFGAISRVSLSVPPHATVLSDRAPDEDLSAALVESSIRLSIAGEANF